jgi:hypothetical protein
MDETLSMMESLQGRLMLRIMESSSKRWPHLRHGNACRDPRKPRTKDGEPCVQYHGA